MAEEGEEITALIPRKDIPDDLYEDYLKKRQEAIRGLIFGETPEEVIRDRKGRGGLRFKFVPIAWFIQQLNLIFKHQWDFEVLDHEIVKDQVWVKGRLTVRGEIGVVVSKTQFGGSDVKYTHDGKMIDIADDFKAASSDCLKKCASLLGLAWDVYSGEREALTETGPSVPQLLAFYKRGEAAGMDKDALDEWFTKQKDINQRGVKPEEAVSAEILGAIPKLVKIAKEKESG